MPAGVVVLFLAALAAFGLIQSRALSGAAAPGSVKTAHIDNEFELYRKFVQHAVEYMMANPGANGTFYWSAIASGLKLPPSMANAGMPPDWRIVANGTSYVLCTEMRNDETPARIKRLIAERPEQVNRVSSKWVVGDPVNHTELTSEAAKCS